MISQFLKFNFRLLALILVFINSIGLRAQTKECSQYISQNTEMSRAVDYLRTISGHYRLGSCQIELHVCDQYSSNDSPGSIVGDLLITNKFGRKSTVQLDFPKENTKNTSIDIQNGKIMFHYEFDDRHKDPVFGNRESLRIEFLKSLDLKNLISMEEGFYASTNHSPYQWTICHGKTDIAGIQFDVPDEIVGHYFSASTENQKNEITRTITKDNSILIEETVKVTSGTGILEEKSCFLQYVGFVDAISEPTKEESELLKSIENAKSNRVIHYIINEVYLDGAKNNSSDCLNLVNDKNSIAMAKGIQNVWILTDLGHYADRQELADPKLNWRVFTKNSL